MKDLIKTNIVNVVLLLLVGLIYVVFNNVLDFGPSVSLGVTGVAGLIWVIYTLYSNYSALNTKDNPISNVKVLKEFQNAGKRSAFSMERKSMATMYESIMAREKYFMAMGKDSRLTEAYLMIRLQAEQDLMKARDFINSYDYVYGVYGRDTKYLAATKADMESLVSKLNQLVELSYSLDDNLQDVDMRRVDDLIESLEEMRAM